MKYLFPPGLTFLASVFWTFLPYFSVWVLRRIQSPYLIKNKFVAGGSRTRVVSVTDIERYPIRPRKPMLTDPISNVLFEYKVDFRS